jgi:hypothetical protein
MVALSSLGGSGSSGAGSPKEFLNTTLTHADLVNDKEWNVLVNDADTVSVIEEIFIDISVVPQLLGGTPALFNGPMEISTGTVGLSGFEVVGKGQTLKYVLPEIPTAGTLTYDGNQAGFHHIISSTVTNVTRGTGVVSKSGSNYPIEATDLELVQDYIDSNVTELNYGNFTSTVPSMTNDARWFYETATFAWYFQYDGNSTTRIYRSAKSNGNYGAWVLTYNLNYAYPALDMINEKIYYHYGNTLYDIDMNTAAETTVGTFSSPSSSSYACASFVNGVFFWIPSNSYSTTVYWVNVNDLTSGTITLDVAVSFSSDMMFASSYDPVNDEYHFVIGYNNVNSTRHYLVAGSLSSGSTFLGTLASKTPLTLGEGFYHGDELGNFFVIDSNNRTRIINYVGSDDGVIDSSHVFTTVLAGTGWFKKNNGTPFSTTVNLPVSLIAAKVNLKLKVSGTST